MSANQGIPSRIGACFEQLRSAKKTALIPYIVVGDPLPSQTTELMHALVAGGANLIELGVPFSDPEADGPDIQIAHERALQHNVSLEGVLATVAKFRQQDDVTPVVLMTYLNPIEQMGYVSFAKASSSAGVDGVLVVNMPPEEGRLLQSELSARTINSIYLVAPTTTTERAHQLAKQGSGFLYYVSLKGTTGASHFNVHEARLQIQNLRTVTRLPLAIGFGIRDSASASAAAEFADAVVVGAAIVRRIAALIDAPDLIAAQLTVFMQELRAAMDQI